MTAGRARCQPSKSWRETDTHNIVAADSTGALVPDPTEHKVPLRENIVLRAAIYYAALFSVAALLYRLPQAKAVLHGSFESLFSSGGTFDLGATKPKNIPPVSIDATT